MATINRVILAGNLTRDPVLRKTPSGISVCDMRIAVSERFRNAAGEQQERTLFIDVVAWERQADNCAKFLAKGQSILVDGHLRQEDYKTREGEPRSKVSVMAQNVQFLSAPNRDAPAAPHTSFAPAADSPTPPSAADDEEAPF